MSTEIGGRPVLRPAGNVATKSRLRPSCVATGGLMTTEIGGRPVLRPAGNVALRYESGDARAIIRKVTKPPSSPVKPAATPVAKNPPPNTQPATPKGAALPQSRSPVLNPALPCKPAPSPSSRKTPAIPHSPTNLCLPPGSTSLSKVRPSSAASGCARNSADPPCAEGDSVAEESATITDSLPHLSLDSEHVEHKVTAKSARVPVMNCPRSSASQQRKIDTHIDLTRSSAEIFLKGRGATKARPKTNLSKVGSLSLNEISFADIMSGKKAAAKERDAQKKFRIAEYGRKPGKASRIAPDVGSLPPIPNEPKRCKFITAQSGPLHVAYHDEEWGVPVHDDRTLFELLILAGAQVELSWSTILNKREAYRSAFSGFDPAAVATFKEKHIQSLEADRSLLLPGGMIRGVVENARRILEVGEDYGSLDNYLWGFLNHKPLLNSYRYPKQVPVKTSKAEGISKDLVKRGFRFVGPTIIYSFMQAAGMTNDHLVQCFRHRECEKLSSVSQEDTQEKQRQEQSFMHCHCEIFSLPVDVDQEIQTNEDQHSSGKQQQQPEYCTERRKREEESFTGDKTM